MCNSAAARLEDSSFMCGLSMLLTKLSPGATAKLIGGHKFVASRITVAFAQHVLNITQHLESHGFKGFDTLRIIIGASSLAAKMAELEEMLLSRNTHTGLEAFLQRFRGSYKRKPD